MILNQNMYYLVKKDFENGKDKIKHFKGEKLNYDGNAVINDNGDVVFYSNSENYIKYGVEVFNGKEIK